MRPEILDVLQSHFGKQKDITIDTHLMDDLNGDEFDIIDVIMKIEESLDITIPEEDTFDIMTVSALCEVVDKHVRST